MDTAYDVSWELGRGCGSTAWCYSCGPRTTGGSALLGEVSGGVLRHGPDTLFSSGLNPAGGRVEPVAGGLRISGRWGFSSGCDAATWAMVAVTGARAGSLMWLLLPRPDYEDPRHLVRSAACGGAAAGRRVKDAFVPAHRASRIS